MRPRMLAIGCAAMLLAAPTAWAHHSNTMFNIEKELTIQGTVTEFQWTNPHSWVEVLVRESDGRDVQWSIEAPSPSTLMRYGWKRTSIKPGDKVDMLIHPLKDGRTGGSMLKATVNGQVIGASASG